MESHKAVGGAVARIRRQRHIVPQRCLPILGRRPLYKSDDTQSEFVARLDLREHGATFEGVGALSGGGGAEFRTSQRLQWYETHVAVIAWELLRWADPPNASHHRHSI